MRGVSIPCHAIGSTTWASHPAVRPIAGPAESKAQSHTHRCGDAEYPDTGRSLIAHSIEIEEMRPARRLIRLASGQIECATDSLGRARFLQGDDRIVHPYLAAPRPPSQAAQDLLSKQSRTALPALSPSAMDRSAAAQRDRSGPGGHLLLISRVIGATGII